MSNRDELIERAHRDITVLDHERTRWSLALELINAGWRPVVEDDETVDRLAMGWWLATAHRTYPVPESHWEKATDDVKDRYRRDARIVLRALRGEAR